MDNPNAMRVSFRRPTPAQLTAFLEKSGGLPFSYSQTGASAGEFPDGFDHDVNAVYLGEGEDLFRRAKDALFNWVMFPPGWTFAWSNGRLPEKGTPVAVVFRLFGLWWLNGAKVVYRIDAPAKAGFAYGTLANHIECGEEQFAVELRPDGSVWYTLKAFSRPRFLPARMIYPVARRFQRRFVRHSFLAMKKALAHE